MKKFLICIFAISLMIVPFSAFAMDVLSDSEMDAVTAQTGVDIRVEDVSLDLEIMNTGWGDNDCGTVMVSGVPVAYSQGYVNISGLKVKNFYMTMNTNSFGSMARRATTTLSSSDSTSELKAVLVQQSAHPLTIDVFTGSTDPRESSF
jgi:hypothetical protein